MRNPHERVVAHLCSPSSHTHTRAHTHTHTAFTRNTHTGGKKDSPSDTLLKNMIEKAHLKYGGGDDCKFFEFRSSPKISVADSCASYDAAGLISDPKYADKFTSLAQWAHAIKKRTVSVKPNIFYRNQSLRQLEVPIYLGPKREPGRKHALARV